MGGISGQALNSIHLFNSAVSLFSVSRCINCPVKKKTTTTFYTVFWPLYGGGRVVRWSRGILLIWIIVGQAPTP